MTLTLKMLRCPDSVPPQTRSLAGGEFSIGRGAENDWVLPDPERGLSKCHCVFAYRSGGWQIADLSTNGAFLNRESEPIGRGQTRDLRDGDRLNLGPYEIEIRISAAAASPREPAASNPFADDIFAMPEARPGSGLLSQDPAARLDGSGDPFAVNLAPPSINLPPDYDPLAPDPPDEALGHPTQADHSAHIEDAFAAPLAHSVLPADWDREAAPQPRPERRLTEAASQPVPAPAAAPVPVAAAPLRAEALRGEVAAPAVPLAREPQAGDLLTAFLRGCGVRDARPADPPAAMEALGKAFRALVSGVRRAMIGRAAIKSEFRIEQTLIRSHGNNPLKFSADDDDALSALLNTGRRSEMDAAEAVSDALRDIRLHEIAMVAAMQSAVRVLLEELEPARLRRAAEHRALDFVPAQRKAHAWDEFEALHGKISRALEDDFDSVFGKAFARAYERALGEASARERGE